MHQFADILPDTAFCLLDFLPERNQCGAGSAGNVPRSVPVCGAAGPGGDHHYPVSAAVSVAAEAVVRVIITREF